MVKLDDLIVRLRAGDVTLEEFAVTAAAGMVSRTPSDGVDYVPDLDAIDGVSSVSLLAARVNGDLTADEVAAVWAAHAARS